MRKNAHFKLQLRTKLSTGNWIGWDTVTTKESAYRDEINLPKKSEISDWFRKYAKENGMEIDAQVGFWWQCSDDNQQYEFRVVNRKDDSQTKI